MSQYSSADIRAYLLAHGLIDNGNNPVSQNAARQIHGEALALSVSADELDRALGWPPMTAENWIAQMGWQPLTGGAAVVVTTTVGPSGGSGAAFDNSIVEEIRTMFGQGSNQEQVRAYVVAHHSLTEARWNELFAHAVARGLFGMQQTTVPPPPVVVTTVGPPPSARVPTPESIAAPSPSSTLPSVTPAASLPPQYPTYDPMGVAYDPAPVIAVQSPPGISPWLIGGAAIVAALLASKS